MGERNITFKNLDTDDLKYLIGKGREVEEAYCAFYTTKKTAKIPELLPFSRKIDSKAKASALPTSEFIRRCALGACELPQQYQ